MVRDLQRKHKEWVAREFVRQGPFREATRQRVITIAMRRARVPAYAYEEARAAVEKTYKLRDFVRVQRTFDRRHAFTEMREQITDALRDVRWR